jgi:hypothetical protein
VSLGHAGLNQKNALCAAQERRATLRHKQIL